MNRSADRVSLNALSEGKSHEDIFQQMLLKKPCAHCQGTNHCAKFCFKLPGNERSKFKKKKNGSKDKVVGMSSGVGAKESS